MIENLKIIFKTSPLKTISLLILGWIIMIGLNYYLNEHHFFTGTRITFPMSVVYISEFTIFGFLFAFSFLLLGLYTLKNIEKINTNILLIVSITLIILGNFSQGSIHQIFLRSFIDTDFQYYHDAIKITNGYNFISTYLENQDQLTMHAKTHPPFTVWIHYLFLKLTNHSPLGLALFMSLVGLLPILVFNKILDIFPNLEKFNKNILLLIFVLIPAINIYSIVSIDAQFLLYTLLFIYGLLIIDRSEKLNIKGILITFLGFTLANLISFSGTFLAALAFFYCIYQIIKNKKLYPFLNFSLVGMLFIFILVILYFTLNYNHLEAFLQASKSENPNGFRGFDQPLVYIFTRLENISEILLFLSFGFFAYLFKPKVFNFNKTQIQFTLPIIAFSTLMLMFITGAYGTGETARACLYIYPFFLLLLINIKNSQILINIAYIALVQTFFMQLVGDYFW